jgi:hypothetical protein
MAIHPRRVAPLPPTEVERPRRIPPPAVWATLSVWDPGISVAGASISVASVSNYPHSIAAFTEFCFVISRQALPEKAEIPKLVSLDYRFGLKFVSSPSRTENSTIDSILY